MEYGLTTNTKPEIAEYKLVVRLFGGDLIRREWLKNGRFYNERYYRNIISKLDL